MSVFRKYPPTFWVANSMEIFERMAWYGFYAVSSLYITGAPETGGLGFSSEQRGIIQGIIPFLLYLFPVVTGALVEPRTILAPATRVLNSFKLRVLKRRFRT